MVLKTREKLIEVARQLFAHKGIENTTMNDIANASEKGRRTIYTYFKNKKEIYNAVIERESEKLISRLREVENEKLQPLEKLERFMIVRFDLIKKSSSVSDNSIISFFKRDVKRVEQVRKLAFEKETEIIKNIIREGVEAEVFDVEQSKYLLSTLIAIIQGIDIVNIKDNSLECNLNQSEYQKEIIKFVINGIKSKYNVY